MLALDIDDILADTTRTRFFTLTRIFGDCGMTFEEAMKIHGGRNNTIWTSPEAQHWMNEKNHDNEYQKSLALVDHALESVQLLHNHYQPFSYYITARPESVLSGTKERLEYHGFPHLPIIIRPTSITREQEHIRKVGLLYQLYKEGVSGIIDDQMKLLHHMENLHPDYSGSLHIIGKENNLSTQLNHTISQSRPDFITQLTNSLATDTLLHNKYYHMIKGIDFTGISVSTLVYHPEQGFLFGHRTDQCRDERRKRDNRGGGLKFGEEISDGMKRELEEEFGRTFKDNQIHTLGYREQFREHNGKKSHRIAFYHVTILDGTETITNMEPHKHDELKYFPIDKLPTQAESHSMLYPTLIEFKGKIEELIGKKIVL